MYKIHKPFIILVILLLPSWAMAFTYTSDQVNISRLLPYSYSQKPSMPVGGWTSSTPVYSFAGEAQVIPPTGGDVLKKVLPLTLSFGKAMPWLALSFTAGYMLGDYIYDNWLSSKSLAYVDGAYVTDGFINDAKDGWVAPVGTTVTVSYAGLTATGPIVDYFETEYAADVAQEADRRAHLICTPTFADCREVYDTSKLIDGYTIKLKMVYTVVSGITPNPVPGVYFYAYHANALPLVQRAIQEPVADSEVWADFVADAQDMPELSEFVENQIKKIAPEYNAYQTQGVQPTETTVAQINALEDALSDELTLDDTVPVDDTDYVSTLESINSSPDFSELISALAELDHTNDDKTSPDEITQGIDNSELKTEVAELSEFIQEEPEAGLTDYSESDLPEHLQNLTPDSSTAYAWFLSKVSDIRSAIDSKITTNFSGSCLVYFDFGRFGETTVSACEYQDHLALMGNFLVGITALMGFITVLRG